MTSTADRRSLVLQVGDVAGVGTALTKAISASPSWRAEQILLSTPASSAPLLKRLEFPRRALQTRRSVEAAVHQYHPDVVHLHWARYAPFVRRVGVPLIVHAHGSDVRGRSKTIAGRIVTTALRRADLVLVSTPDLIDEVGVSARYLPNPVDTNLFCTDGVGLSNSTGKPTILVFARLLDVKGACTILDATQLLQRQLPECTILAVSGGSYDHVAAQHGLVMLPWLSAAELAALLPSVDVVIGQQMLGSLGLSELEAMSSGRPVVTRLRRELYPSEVPVISVASPEAIADECVRLVRDPVAASHMGAAARSYALRHHSLGVVTDALGSIYDEIIGA